MVDELRELGLYRGDREHAMTVPVCSRSGDVIEPKLCAQWYLDCKDMAGQAVDAVKTGELELIPSRFEKTWSQWLGRCKLLTLGKPRDGARGHWWSWWSATG